MNRQELFSLLFDNMNNMTVWQGTLNLLMAFVCAIIVYMVYYFTTKDTKPTAAFAKTILIVTLSTCLILMLIGSNLALSLGMVGALSIIRFRAAVKDSRDASFIFYAVAAGMTTALGVYELAFIGTCFIGATVVVFSFLKIGSYTYILTVRTCSNTSHVEEEIKKITRNRYSVIAISHKQNQDDTRLVETVYEVGLKNGAGELCQRLLQQDGIVSVNAILREDA